MAQGDPMVMETENLTDYGGMDESGGTPSGVALGWAGWADAGIILSPSIDTTNQRTGAGCQKLVITATGAGAAGIYTDIALVGRSDLDAMGHKGSVIRLSFWGKGTEDERLRLYIEEIDADNNKTAHTARSFSMTSNYIEYTGDFTLGQSDTVTVRCIISKVYTGAATPTTYYIDDFSVKEVYTFARNPSMPEENVYTRDGKNFRTANRTLHPFVHPAAGIKLRGTLSWGLVSEEQMTAMRSLWLWHKQITWTPYLNKLPSSVNIWLTDNEYNFGAVSSNLGVGYRGSLTYQEV